MKKIAIIIITFVFAIALAVPAYTADGIQADDLNEQSSQFIKLPNGKVVSQEIVKPKPEEKVVVDSETIGMEKPEKGE